jgi:hypothetical protein
MLVTLLKRPSGPFDLVASSNQGTAPATGASARCFSVPTIRLPSLDCQCGPAPWRPIDLPCASKSSASGATNAHSYPVPAFFPARHS